LITGQRQFKDRHSSGQVSCDLVELRSGGGSLLGIIDAALLKSVGIVCFASVYAVFEAFWRAITGSLVAFRRAAAGVFRVVQGPSV